MKTNANYDLDVTPRMILFGTNNYDHVLTHYTSTKQIYLINATALTYLNGNLNSYFKILKCQASCNSDIDKFTQKCHFLLPLIT